MRVLVCGGRDFDDRRSLFRVLDVWHERTPISLLIYGGQRGADDLARVWAHHHKVETLPFRADWASLGGAAGPIRNKQMLDDGKPQIVLAFPRKDGSIGKGTADMIRQARWAGVRVIQPMER